MPAISTVMSLKTPSAPPRNPGALMQTARPPGVEANAPQFNSEEEVKLDDSGDVIESTALPPAKVNDKESGEDSTEEVSTAAPIKEQAESAVKSEKKDEPELEGFNLPEEKITEEKTTPVKQDGATKPIPSGPRNYDQYPEDLRPVLRALNNTQFKEFAPKLKELYERANKVAELEQRLEGKPQFFYEHPEAYRLDPEYNQLVSNISAIQFESSHWQDQMARIERGEAWYDLQGYDNKGQPVYKEYPAPEDGVVDYRIKAAVQQRIAQLASLDINTRNQLGQFQAQYQNSRQSSLAELEELDKKLFPKVADVEKLPSEEKKYYEMAQNLSPRAFRNHPLMRPLGKSYVAFMRLFKMYKELGHKYDQLRGIGEDAKHSEPVVIPNGGVEKQKRQLKRGEIDPDEEIKLGSDED